MEITGYSYKDRIPFEGSPEICGGTLGSYNAYWFWRLLLEHPEYNGKYIFISEGEWIAPLLKKVDSRWNDIYYYSIALKRHDTKYTKRLNTFCNVSIPTILRKLNSKDNRTNRLLKNWFEKYLSWNRTFMTGGEFAIRLKWQDTAKETIWMSLIKFPYPKNGPWGCRSYKENPEPNPRSDYYRETKFEMGFGIELVTQLFFLSTSDWREGNNWFKIMKQLIVDKKTVFSEDEFSNAIEGSLTMFKKWFEHSEDNLGDESSLSESFYHEKTKFSRFDMLNFPIEIPGQEFFHFSLKGDLFINFFGGRKLSLEFFMIL
jgi:hypothetical protein